ncbi:mediator of RNA polymerase II transcription subunit 14-like isoform X2 [Ornithodoros turicata]|uniref:mediator of RNA polymerase II transcription subunit 14-like isoform X2 n=1 Tax=Ornithodoros turicata TaxID=34597 RepID=UPI003138C2B4
MAMQLANTGGPSIPLGRLIDFILQRTYHELTVLAELLPRKTDVERKMEIVQFASTTRQLFVRLLALVKWASSAAKVEKCAAIVAFLDKQNLLFVETADILAMMARETLVQARLPSFHIPCAVEVLTLGTYSRLPTCIRDKIVPPDPITPAERRSTLHRLDQIIQYRLVSSDLPSQMSSLRIENGRVIFHVEHEFEVSLTLMGDGPHVPWRLLDIDVLVEDKDTGDCRALVHPLQVQYIHQLIQSRLVDNPKPLHELYNCLHSFCLSLQLEVIHSQLVRLCRERLGDFIRVQEYTPGHNLAVQYWRDQALKEKQTYQLNIHVDTWNPGKPLRVAHTPSLGAREANWADQAIKSEFLSIEKLLIQTIHIRTKEKLAHIRDRLQTTIGNQTHCIISGSPAILQVPLLQPCMESENLLITVDTHTGYFLAFVPQHEPPMIDDIQDCLNKDGAKLDSLLTDLKFWMTVKRCEKTVQHLPVVASTHLPLVVPQGHPALRLGPHTLYIKLCKHHNCYVVVELSQSSSEPQEIVQTYYLMTVEPQPLPEGDPATLGRDDAPLDTELPKAFLRVANFLQLDTFAIVHGPCTKIDASLLTGSGKRKLLPANHVQSKRPRFTGYFMSELAHVVAFCDDRIPFCTLTVELNKRDICHQGMQIEANGTNFLVKIVQMGSGEGWMKDTAAALQASTLSCSLRLQVKGIKAWLAEFVFCNCPLTSLSPKERGPRRPVCFMYDFAAGTSAQVASVVEEMLQDWNTIGHLYGVVLRFAQAINLDQQNTLMSIVDIKSFTYKKLVLGYGLNKASTVTIYWRPSEKRFHLAFGVVGHTASASNPHTVVSAQLQHEFNQHRSVATLVEVLRDTYAPLLSLTKLPSAPQLGVINSRPQVPVQTFVIIPQSSMHIRLAYRNTYVLDIHCRPEGLIAVRDGAYSKFDKTKAVEDFTPIQGLRAFLSKFVDESACQLRRRSQSEDDNPPSPIPTLDSMESFLSSGSALKPSSPAQRPQDPAGAGGLRFHHPMTPPSNPHTPASPHPSVLSQNYVASPNPSFASLASPPSLGGTGGSGPHVSPSPSHGLHVQAQSPGNLFGASSPVNPLHAPSPSFLPSPSSQVPMTSPVPQGFMGSQASHPEGGSPFPTPAGSMSMASPAPGTWPGSPSVPRPSPRLAPSPHGAPMQSPQTSSMDHKPPQAVLGPGGTRVLPQRSWAAAMPTLLSHKGLDLLCSSGGGTPPQSPPLPHCSPLERFLGSVFMRKSLHRVVQNEDNMTMIPTQEPGVIQFRTESLQCKVSLNPATLQSLHLKLNPTEQWSPEELQVLERYFDTKVASFPYKPNAFMSFTRLMTAPLSILKDFVQLMRLELMPDRNMKWSVQLCLTIPPAAPPIAPPGMSSIVMIRNKVLFFLQLSRTSIGEPAQIAVPVVYDTTANTLQVADKRVDASVVQPSAPVAIIGSMLRRYTEYAPPTGECCIFPSIRDILINLTIPSQ